MSIENSCNGKTVAFIGTGVFSVSVSPDKMSCMFLLTSPANLLAFIEAWEDGEMANMSPVTTINVCYLPLVQPVIGSRYNREKIDQYLFTLFHEVTGVELKETEVIRGNAVAKELTAIIPKKKEN